MKHRTKQNQARQPFDGKLSVALITFLGQYTGAGVSTNSQTTYVNCCLMQRQTKQICFQSVLRSSLHHPSGVWASLIILSCPIIIVYGLGDRDHNAICSDPIEAEIRGVEGHMSGGQSGDTSF